MRIRPALIPIINRMATSKLFVDPAQIAEAEKDDWAKLVTIRCVELMLTRFSAFARIENHYFVNEVCWTRPIDRLTY